MLSFVPSSKLEKALEELKNVIAQHVQMIATLDENERKWLHKSALISSIGATTRIENAVLTDAEIEWVDTILTESGNMTAFEEKRSAIIDKLSKDRERSIEEVVGCREILSVVYTQAEEFFPLTESTLRGMHKILLSYYPKAAAYAGCYKTSINTVISINHDTGEQRTVLNPTPPGPLTETAMKDLVDWYNKTIQTYRWPLLVATEFVFRFLAIHPFQDGNGRLGRALFLMSLIQNADPDLKRLIPFVSIDRQIERYRPLYYTTLRNVSGGQYKADPRDYDLEQLAWFFLKMMHFSIEDLSTLRQRYHAFNKLSENARTVLGCFKASPEKRLTVSDIIKITNLGRRNTQNALVSLVKNGFLQRLGMGPATRYQLTF